MRRVTQIYHREEPTMDQMPADQFQFSYHPERGHTMHPADALVHLAQAVENPGNPYVPSLDELHLAAAARRDFEALTAANGHSDFIPRNKAELDSLARGLVYADRMTWFDRGWSNGDSFRARVMHHHVGVVTRGGAGQGYLDALDDLAKQIGHEVRKDLAKALDRAGIDPKTEQSQILMRKMLVTGTKPLPEGIDEFSSNPRIILPAPTVNKDRGGVYGQPTEPVEDLELDPDDDIDSLMLPNDSSGEPVVVGEDGRRVHVAELAGDPVPVVVVPGAAARPVVSTGRHARPDDDEPAVEPVSSPAGGPGLRPVTPGVRQRRPVPAAAAPAAPAPATNGASAEPVVRTTVTGRGLSGRVTRQVVSAGEIVPSEYDVREAARSAAEEQRRRDKQQRGSEVSDLLDQLQSKGGNIGRAIKTGRVAMRATRATGRGLRAAGRPESWGNGIRRTGRLGAVALSSLYDGTLRPVVEAGRQRRAERRLRAELMDRVLGMVATNPAALGVLFPQGGPQPASRPTRRTS